MLAKIYKPTWGTRRGPVCLRYVPSCPIIDGPHSISKLWQYRLWSFQGRDTKLERFLAKSSITQGPRVYKSSYNSTKQVINNLSWRICSDYNSKMMIQSKIILLLPIFHIVHSSDKDLEIDSTTSHESCVEPDETTSESNCFCYNEPEKDFEYSICSPTIDTTTTTTPFICPVQTDNRYPANSYRLVQGKCFYFERQYMNWEGARDNCKQKGGKLFEPKSVAEMKQIALIAYGVSGIYYTFAWIGITDIASEGTFVYDSNGQSITFNNGNIPGPIEPSNPLWGYQGRVKPISNDCVALITGAAHMCQTCQDMGKMLDLACSYKSCRSICEL